MSAPRAPSPPVQEALSPPPSESGESVAYGVPDPSSATAVQLAGRASHLTLSGSGSDAESPRTGAARIGAATLQSPALSSLPDAQLALEIVQVRWIQKWREEAIITPIGVAMSPALPPSVSGAGPWIAEMHASAQTPVDESGVAGSAVTTSQNVACSRHLLDLPNEVLLQILSNLEVCDLLATSRTSHLLRRLAVSPFLHRQRLRHARAVLPPLLTSPSRPSLADLIRRSIFLTNTTVLSRRLSRSLAAIHLQRRLAKRPSPETLVARSVLPPECVPYVGGSSSVSGGGGSSIAVAPALVARRRAVERERVKDGLRRWVGSEWKGEVRSRGEGVRRWEERAGVGRVWRLRRFWERLGNGEGQGRAGG